MQIILDSLCGFQGDGIVHGLFQNLWARQDLRQRLFLVSRFAADSLMERFRGTLGDLMAIADQLWTTACALENGAVQGWAFEFRLYTLICKCVKDNLDTSNIILNPLPSPLSWPNRDSHRALQTSPPLLHAYIQSGL